MAKHRVGVESLFSGFFGTAVFCGASPGLSERGVSVEPLFCLDFWDRGRACARGAGQGTLAHPFKSIIQRKKSRAALRVLRSSLLFCFCLRFLRFSSCVCLCVLVCCTGTDHVLPPPPPPPTALGVHEPVCVHSHRVYGVGTKAMLLVGQ